MFLQSDSFFDFNAFFSKPIAYSETYIFLSNDSNYAWFVLGPDSDQLFFWYTLATR